MLATAELLAEAAQPGVLAGELVRCAAEVPLYRRSTPPLRGEAGPLATWPLITKADIARGFPGNFLPDDVELEDLLEREVVELEHTSGTSEARTPLLLPKGWWAEQELRAFNLNGRVAEVLRRNPNARRATINSPVCSGEVRYNGVPSRCERQVGNTLFVSLSRYPFLWAERDFERIVEEILEWAPDFLDVDPVYGVVFALYCEQHRVRLPSLKFIICSYEFVSLVHRSILSRVFGVPVLDLYGSTETGHLLMENENSQVRPTLETAFLELLDPDEFGIGELVVSTLTNPFMPLIRYRIGDLVERFETPYGGRYRLHGRVADMFRLHSGKRVSTWQLDQCFSGISGIAHYQVIQKLVDQWTLRYVPERAASPSTQALADLVAKLTALLEAAEPVQIEETRMLVPEKSGKFRLGYPLSKRSA